MITPHTNLAPSLVSYKYELSKQRSYLFAFIFTCSILIGLSLYHITIYFITHETLYLYFSLFSFFSGLLAASFKGYLLELFFSEFPRQHYQYAFLIAAVGFHISMWIFVRKYLSIKKWAPLWNTILTIVFLYCIVSIIMVNVHKSVLLISINLIFLIIFIYTSFLAKLISNINT